MKENTSKNIPDNYKNYSDMFDKKIEELLQEEFIKTMEKNLLNSIESETLSDTSTYIATSQNDENALTEEKLKKIIDDLNAFDTNNNSIIPNGSTTTSAMYTTSPNAGGGITYPLWQITTMPTYYPGIFNTTTTWTTYEDPQPVKIKQLEKRMELILKFLVMKGVIESEEEFSNFLDSVEIMEKLIDEGEEK